MKLSDINQKLTERPGGFGGIVKSKLKKQLSPFQKGKQQAADDEGRLIKVARDMKKDLKVWMTKAFRSSGGAKAPLSMEQFLTWVKKSQPKYEKGILQYARENPDYAKYFSNEIGGLGGKQQSKEEREQGLAPGSLAAAASKKAEQEKAGMHSVAGNADELELEKDPSDGKSTPDENAQGEAQQAAAAEQEAKDLDSENPKHDLKASKGDDKEPKVDTSASIYEARLRAILEADEEAEAKPEAEEKSDKPLPLEDNLIDTLITMGIEKQIEIGGGESIIDRPSDLSSSGVSKPAAQGGSSEASDDFLGEYQAELENVLTKVKTGGKDIDKRDQQSANDMLNSI